MRPLPRNYTDVLELDLSTVQPSLAGPKRPQDRVPLKDVKENFERALTQPKNERWFRPGTGSTWKALQE